VTPDPPREAPDPAEARTSGGAHRSAHREAPDASQTVEGDPGGEGVAHHAVVTRFEDGRRSPAAERRERVRDRVPRSRASAERLDATIARRTAALSRRRGLAPAAGRGMPAADPVIADDD